MHDRPTKRGQGEQFSPRIEDEPVPRAVQLITRQITVCGHEAGLALGPRVPHLDGDLVGSIGGRVVQPNLSRHLVHDAVAVGRRQPGVMVVVVRMPGDVVAGQRTRIEVADPLVVR